MNTRRRFLPFVPALPFLGPLAVKAGAAVQTMGQKTSAVPELLFKHGEASSPYWLRVNGNLYRLDNWLPPNVVQRFSEQIGGNVRWMGSTTEPFGAAVGTNARRIADAAWRLVEPMTRMNPSA